MAGSKGRYGATEPLPTPFLSMKFSWQGRDGCTLGQMLIFPERCPCGVSLAPQEPGGVPFITETLTRPGALGHLATSGTQDQAWAL